MQARVAGIGLRGPGLDGFAASRAILAGEVSYEARDTAIPPAELLPPTERRRCGPVVRLALAVAVEAVRSSGLDPARLRSVFASSTGDGLVVGSILETLAGPDTLVSPTQFHNSVHNAAAGYWSIGTGSRQPAGCLGLYDATFAAALLKAMAEVVVERVPVLLVAYDVPLPAPLAAKRPIGGAFGLALVLAPAEGATGSLLDVAYEAAPAEEIEDAEPALRAGLGGNPAARSLPLLRALAGRRAARFDLAFPEGRLSVSIAP